MQAPAPSQERPVCMPPEQEVVPKAVPLMYFWQAPTPSQTPLRPQDGPPSSGQSASGSVPSVTALQVPLAPPVLAAEQAWQVPLQGASQQKPSTQLPDVHWEPLLQLAPLA